MEPSGILPGGFAPFGGGAISYQLGAVFRSTFSLTMMVNMLAALEQDILSAAGLGMAL